MSNHINTMPLLSDNYAFVLHNETDAVVVDPGDAGPVLRFLADHDLRLSIILLTHHHADLCAGAAGFKKATGCRVVGPTDPRLKIVDDTVNHGDHRDLLAAQVEVIATPGHTRTHLVYHVAALSALFTGDTLFGAGCGRLFEGSPVQMWESLTKCAALPDETRVYCGHENTEDNLEFALSIEPENAKVKARLAQTRGLRRQGLPTVPSTLALERETNPFLRVGDTSLRKSIGMESATDAAVFAEVRARKDRY
jgi:hydroxyacylglutathione hydrolase